MSGRLLWKCDMRGKTWTMRRSRVSRTQFMCVSRMIGPSCPPNLLFLFCLMESLHHWHWCCLISYLFQLSQPPPRRAGLRAWQEAQQLDSQTQPVSSFRVSSHHFQKGLRTPAVWQDAGFPRNITWKGEWVNSLRDKLQPMRDRSQETERNWQRNAPSSCRQNVPRYSDDVSSVWTKFWWPSNQVCLFVRMQPSHTHHLDFIFPLFLPYFSFPLIMSWDYNSP